MENLERGNNPEQPEQQKFCDCAHVQEAIYNYNNCYKLSNQTL